MAQNVAEKVMAKFPNVEPITTRTTSKTKVYRVKTDGGRQALLDKLKVFLKNERVTEVWNKTLSSSVPVLEVMESGIKYIFVIKPMSSNRAATGMETQQVVADRLVQDFSVTIISKASLSSQAQDLVFQINSFKEGAEIKGVVGMGGSIATFDRSVSRPGIGNIVRADDTPIQQVAHILATANGYKIPGTNPLSEYIDALREHDHTIGYSGDVGVVGNGGKLPATHFMSTNSDVIKKILKVIEHHFHKGGDNYFIVYDRQSKNYIVFDTEMPGTSQLKNTPLGKKKIAPFNSSTVSTAGIGIYGTLQGTGKLRVALYIKLNSSAINKYVIKPET